MTQYIYPDCRSFAMEMLQHLNSDTSLRAVVQDAVCLQQEIELVNMLKNIQDENSRDVIRLIGFDLSWKLRFNIRVWIPSMTEWFDKFDHERYNKIKQMRLGR